MTSDIKDAFINLTRQFLIIASAVLLSVACGVAPPTRMQTSSPGGTSHVITKNDEVPLYSPSGKELIIDAQKMLTEEGYATGQIDGVIGKKTISALRRYQADNSLIVTGVIDEPTYLSLKNKKEFISTKENTPQNETNKERDKSQSSEANKRSMDGLEPVGLVTKKGCNGIEVIGYAEKQLMVYDTLYYMAIRNNNNVAKIVNVRFVGGPRLDGDGSPLSGDVTLKISAGDIKYWEIDYASGPPKLVEIVSCM